MSRRSTLAHMAVTFVAAFTLYAFSAPRTVALEDDGEFIMAVHRLGVPHPPGYPLYVLLAKPLAMLPVGPMAYRVHLASGIFGAATCAVVWLLARMLVGRADAAYAAALAYAASRVFWSQAIVADVYTLNALLFFSLLAVALMYVRSRRPCWLPLLALLFALGLANHWPLLIVEMPAIALALLAARDTLVRDAAGRAGRIVAAVVLGLSPYAWLLWRTRDAPEFAFYGTLASWSDFWFYVTRAGYPASDPTADIGDRMRFAIFFLREATEQFTTIGAVVAIAGLVSQWRHWTTLLSAALLAAFVTGTVGLALVMGGASYDVLSASVVRVFALVPYGIMALWLAGGIAAVLSRAEGWGTGALAVGRLGAAVLVVALVATNARVNDRRGYLFAHDYASTLLESFDRGATVVVHGDLDAYTLGYLHFVEGVRPDLRLVSDQGIGMAMDGRLFDPRRTSAAEKGRQLSALAAEATTPLYFLENTPPYSSDVDYGFYKKVDRSREGQTTFVPRADLIELFRRIERPSRFEDEWTTVQRNVIVSRVAWLLTPLVHLHADDTYAVYRDDLERARGHFTGLLSSIWFIEQYGGVPDDEVLGWIARAERLDDSRVRRRDRAGLYLAKGRILARLGRPAEARRALEYALATDPHPDNEARRLLQQMDARQE